MAYRDDPDIDVVAFTIAQIPGLANRRYPASLAGPLYPQGIPIAEERELENLCLGHDVDRVEFAYSDVPHDHVMHLASRALSAGADFSLLGPKRTMLRAARPVIAITAVRTGCGKSAIARWISARLRRQGNRVAVLRHPMPYGELYRERVQRFATLGDLDLAQCTAEEREEYEPHIAVGNLVFAGVDYAEVVRAAEAEADVIVWDGGNNDYPFVRPDLHITVIDALRPGQITTHHPGETVVRMADVFVINKIDSASEADLQTAIAGLRAIDPAKPIVRAASPIHLDGAEKLSGRSVLVVEDGPTITHGGMAYGAGYLAARAAGATMVDPRGAAAPEIDRIFRMFPHIGAVLPAIGYSGAQLAALEATINAAAADFVVSATPVDLARLLRLNKPVLRTRYDFAEVGEPTLSAIVDAFMHRTTIARGSR
jgi:predicted GTPase